ncbi:MAG: hypothetical protein R2867_20755 [Caldilineaceae bacterium]
MCWKVWHSITAALPDLLSYSAIQLFTETACRLRRLFAPTPANAPAILQICQLVGGMPLGIILAATWIEVLSPAEIVTELRQSFDFLAAEHGIFPSVNAVCAPCCPNPGSALATLSKRFLCG